ncbi:MAG: hypothetical protein J5905_05745 [Prevotella sp.]|nr:hypothetical protein [Prevotella sp.]
MSFFKNELIFRACSPVIFMLVAVFASCDDGSVAEKTYTSIDETYSIEVKGKIMGVDTWSGGYNVVLGGFNEESAYSLIQKSISPDENGEVSITLSGIPKTVKTIEVAAVNNLRIKLASLYSYAIDENQSTNDIISINLGTVDASMLAAIQKGIFEKGDMGCFRCHSSSSAAGKLSLVAGESYASLVNVPSRHDANMMRVVPGDANNSLLYLAMRDNILPSKNHTGYFAGDENSRLLTLLQAWINGGAKR